MLEIDEKAKWLKNVDCFGSGDKFLEISFGHEAHCDEASLTDKKAQRTRPADI